MELLQLRLFQFDRLIEDMLPRIYTHLLDQGIRSTMYASQWFLTFFSYRFPLDLVFRLFDIIFLSGVVNGASGLEGGMMDGFYERMSESVAVATGATGSIKSGDPATESTIVMFRFALALLKKSEETLLVLDFEPLLEFLKHGLFQVFLGNDGNGSLQTEKMSSPRSRNVPAKAIDDLVNYAMGTQFKAVTKRKLMLIKKEYEDEVKKSDPTYLNEKSLESQNQRLAADLKRSENQLAELNRDHCDLAGQLVSLKIDLSKERDVSDALRRQVADLKLVLAAELPKLGRDSLEAVLKHEVSAENAREAQPLSQMEHTTPGLEEQVQILSAQNVRLLEESSHWQSRAETLERSMRETSPKIQTVDPMDVGLISDFKKRFMSPRLKSETPTTPTPPPHHLSGI